MEFFGTEEVAGRSARTEAERAGRCYELAGYALLLGTAPAEAVLVHGSIEGFGNPRIGHAWLVLPDMTTVWEPMQGRFWDARVWAAIAHPAVEASFTKLELAERTSETEHWGPWRT